MATGASGGIGRAIAARLARMDSPRSCTTPGMPTGHAVVEQIKAGGGQAIFA